MSETISILLIEDNRMLREALASLIREQPGFRILAASANIIDAPGKVREAKPRIALVDLALQNHDSLRFIAKLRAEVPEARVIVMGLSPRHKDIADFVAAGASGFVTKDATFDELLHTLRRVADGTEVLPTELTGSLFSQIAHRTVTGANSPVLEAARLTRRERQVVDLIADGLSNKEIAAQLYVATHTVKCHVHNVLEKLALHTRLEVAAFTRGAVRRLHSNSLGSAAGD